MSNVFGIIAKAQLNEIAPQNTKAANITYPIYVCHRGGSTGACPENTMAAYRINDVHKDLPLKYDVRPAWDGAIVICHDSTVNRTSSSTGTVKQMSLEKLKTLDFGTWHNTAFANERIPTMDEVINLLGRRKVHFVDIKDETAVSAITQKIIDAGLVEYAVMVVGYPYLEGADTIKALDKRFMVMANYFTGNPLDDAVTTAVAKGISIINIPKAAITADLITAAHAAGIKVMAYYMRSQFEVAQYTAMGVDAFMCKNPAYLKSKFNTGRTRPWTVDLSMGTFGQEWIYLDDYGLPSQIDMASNALVPKAETNTPYLGLGVPLIGNSTKITLTITPKVLGASAGNYTGIQLNVQDEPVTAFSPVTTGKNGYMFHWTQSGSIRIYKHVSGQAQAEIAAQTGTGNMVVDTPVTFEITLTPTAVSFKRTDNNTTITANDTTFRDNLHLGFYWKENKSAVSDITVAASS